MWREKERKRRGSATLRDSLRAEFCVDHGADGCVHSVSRVRSARTYLGSHRRPRRGVHWFARSQILSFFSPFRAT